MAVSAYRWETERNGLLSHATPVSEKVRDGAKAAASEVERERGEGLQEHRGGLSLWGRREGEKRGIAKKATDDSYKVSVKEREATHSSHDRLTDTPRVTPGGG